MACFAAVTGTPASLAPLARRHRTHDAAIVRSARRAGTRASITVSLPLRHLVINSLVLRAQPAELSAILDVVEMVDLLVIALIALVVLLPLQKVVRV